MKQISVSVIVPVFNAEQHILRTLKNLSEQTLKNIEIIVVDDASTDNSHEVIENFRQQSNMNIVCLQQSENQGVHNARLLGLQHAKGEWIGFVDADDTLRSDMYEKMLEAGNRQQVDIVVCGAHRVSANGKRLSTKVRFKKDEKIISEVFQQFCQLKFGTGSLWNKLYRRDVILPFKTLHFPWRQDINEDMLLNIGCFAKASEVFIIKDILYNYTHNLKSTTSKTDAAMAFSETFRAYAIALSIYPNFSKAEKKYVTDLYRQQLAYSCALVQDLLELASYDQKLEDAVEMINTHYPLGLALLCTRSQPQLSVKQVIYIIIHRLINILK